MADQNYEAYKRVCGENSTKLIRDNYPEGLDDLGFLGYISKKCKTKKNIRKVLGNLENLLYVKNSYLEEGKNREEVENQEELGELLEKAGYEYKVISSVNELKSYEKYYLSGERLCTYNNPAERLKNYHMIIISRKNLDEVKRGDNPQREDDYSTSLLNIQINKQFNNVSIKSRYNHTVNNPDAVYSNNLNKIADGLTGVIGKKLGITINSKNGGDIPDNLKLAEDFIINYWIERNNVYVGEDVYVDNDRINWIDPNQELIADQFLINFKEKTVKDLLKTDQFLIQEDLERALRENKLELKK
jgi:hypothetical protein